ncbi:MAG: hypothetical protein FWG84_06665 [Bacteroidales bacterium]|nr:hypothetical protein [Bacteroidales bacterium]
MKNSHLFYPQVLKSKDCAIYFGNFSGNTFDVAIEYNGKVQYLWGLQSDIEELLTNWNRDSNKSRGFDYLPQNSRERAIFGASLLKATGVIISCVALASGAPILIVFGAISSGREVGRGKWWFIS